MTSALVASPQPSFERIIGTYKGTSPGPTLITIGGIHGNEPAGAIAIRRVLERLEETQPEFRGELFGLAGNLQGLQERKRYIDVDLNRMWRPEHISGESNCSVHESADLKAINQTIQKIAEQSGCPVTIIDFHSFSAPGSPFIISGNKRKHAHLVRDLPAPVVFGLGRFIRGTVMNHFERMGHHAIAIEGGQHDDPETVLNVEAFLWLVLVRAGCLKDRHAPVDLEQCWLRIRHYTKDMPRWVRVKNRYSISAKEKFVMRPGFRNFDVIEKGDHLADNQKGPIYAPITGRILMPLYQGQGNDGFFITIEENFADFSKTPQDNLC